MKTIILTSLMLLAPVALRAENKPEDLISVGLTQDAEDNDILEGHFEVAASTATAWDVLTDYNGMADFVSSIKTSRQIEQREHEAVIEQVMTGKAGIFRKRVTLQLDISENPPEQITFADISEKSFKLYRGSWRMKRNDEKLIIHYFLKAKPNFYSPDFIARSAFKNTVKKLLLEVRHEIVRREIGKINYPEKK